MQPTVKFDRTLVTVLVDEVVHVLLELAAPPAEPIDRSPLDVVVVLDRSGSMGGAPLRAVTQATARLLELAGPHDRIGVVSFDGDVDLVLPLEHHADAAAAAARVTALSAGGSTNLSGGWLKGLEMLACSPRADVLRRVIVLTDGHANAGVTAPDRLVEMITGGRVQGVTTSCIGFDAGYDEQLLAALADAGAGNDYWCDGPDQAAKVFADEFGGLASVVAQNVSVEVRPTDVVASCGVLNEFPITEVPGGMQVALGDAYGGEQRKVVAKFHLRPQPEGPVHVADLVVRWVATGGAFALHTVTVPVAVSAGTGDDCVDPTVREEVLRLEVAKTRREARDAAERGDMERASRRFSAAASMAEAIHGEESMVRELRLDAQHTGMGDWTAMDAKRNYSRSRSAGRGRKSDYTAEPDQPDD